MKTKPIIVVFLYKPFSWKKHKWWSIRYENGYGFGAWCDKGGKPAAQQYIKWLKKQLATKPEIIWQDENNKD